MQGNLVARLPMVPRLPSLCRPLPHTAVPLPLQIFYLSLAISPAAACNASWGPAAVSVASGAALLALTAAGVLPASWQRRWDVGSWTATLLFMLEPLAALVRVWGCGTQQGGACLARFQVPPGAANSLRCMRRLPLS